MLAVAFIAAYAASTKPGDILSLVGAAFSLAGSTLFPALVLGVFWKRANRYGAIAGMTVGFITCVFYMLHTHPVMGGGAANQWFHIAPISAGVCCRERKGDFARPMPCSPVIAPPSSTTFTMTSRMACSALRQCSGLNRSYMMWT